MNRINKAAKSSDSLPHSERFYGTDSQYEASLEWSVDLMVTAVPTAIEMSSCRSRDAVAVPSAHFTRSAPF